MDRLAELAAELAGTLESLRREAEAQGRRELAAQLDWLDEANAWLRYELTRIYTGERDAVPFTYIPVELRR